MVDEGSKRRRWLAELPELDHLLSAAELDTPPAGLEARLLRGLRNAELLERELLATSSQEGSSQEAAPPSASHAGRTLVEPSVTAAEPAQLPSTSRSWLRMDPIWMAAGSAVLAAAALVLLWWGEFPDRSRGAASMLNVERQATGSNGDTAAEHGAAVACTGTYFIRESNGSVNLWTLHLDGTLVNTSLGQRMHDFSTQHGTWKAVGPLSARAVQLDLHWASDGTLSSVGRVDITIRGEKGGCDTVVGEFSGRLFEPGEDFRKPETTSGRPIRYNETFTGSRVDVTP